MSTDNGVTEKERYQRYLAGREWGLLKQQVKARSGGICERCKINPSDAVHHLTYERKYHEDLADLQDICEACHNFTHGKSDKDPAACAQAVGLLMQMARWQGFQTALEIVLDEFPGLPDELRDWLGSSIAAARDEMMKAHEGYADLRNIPHRRDG